MKRNGFIRMWIFKYHLPLECFEHLTETTTRKCDELEAKFAELKSSAARMFSQGAEQVKEKVGG